MRLVLILRVEFLRDASIQLVFHHFDLKIKDDVGKLCRTTTPQHLKCTCLILEASEGCLCFLREGIERNGKESSDPQDPPSVCVGISNKRGSKW